MGKHEDACKKEQQDLFDDGYLERSEMGAHLGIKSLMSKQF